MPLCNFTRRELLRLGGAAAATELGALLLHGCGLSGIHSNPSPGPSGCGSKLTDIEHVVIFHSGKPGHFDHYFGSYRGVRGILGPESCVPAS